MLSPDPRRLWQLLEPIHALVYFAPEPRQAYAEAGLKGGWMGYFASRSAPLGAVAAPVVSATFYNFHPAMVRRSIPDAWGFASPEQVLAARLSGVDAALRRVLGAAVDGEHVHQASALAARALRSSDVGGRPLFAANMALPMPEQPHLALWQRLTCLREHRGDAHVAALLTAGVDGCEANVLQVAAGRMTAQMQQDFRGWSALDWGAATNRLTADGLLEASGGLSEDGAMMLGDIERRTDTLASWAYDTLGDDGRTALADALRPLAAAVAREGNVPYPNPMALPRPGT